ncbi:hypothetical protein CspeluHIS016_0204790 [Cutaneotrichosporon spelunceum]|uniref:Uncharacterized protein n=1 Tax=Cutaneotrichosporon spelunceum TaxID=1672016 RepID=A0AAD3TR59_9TREE|nr:hypothetical protein CspeluHIS016_0204790 [Cutaneotrichosporon spelunceum]
MLGRARLLRPLHALGQPSLGPPPRRHVHPDPEVRDEKPLPEPSSDSSPSDTRPVFRTKPRRSDRDREREPADRADRSDLAGRTVSRRSPNPSLRTRKKEGTLSAVRPGILSHLVTRRTPFQAAVLADEAGDFEIGADVRVDRAIPTIPTIPTIPIVPTLEPGGSGTRGVEVGEMESRSAVESGGKSGSGSKKQSRRTAESRSVAESRGKSMVESRSKSMVESRSKSTAVSKSNATEPDAAKGSWMRWRDLDPARLPRLAAHDDKFHTLPADFETTIRAANARSEKISVRFPLFMATSMPATHVQGGGAPPAPPFPPRLRGGMLPDGLPVSSGLRRHLARRSADARAGSGFAFPCAAGARNLGVGAGSDTGSVGSTSKATPASARLFVLVPKARVSRLSVERRRCRTRFMAAWRLVTRDGAPVSHARVYSFVLNAGMYDAPFADICATVEKAVAQLDRKMRTRGKTRWSAAGSAGHGHG